MHGCIIWPWLNRAAARQGIKHASVGENTTYGVISLAVPSHIFVDR